MKRSVSALGPGNRVHRMHVNDDPKRHDGMHGGFHGWLEARPCRISSSSCVWNFFIKASRISAKSTGVNMSFLSASASHVPEAFTQSWNQF